MYFPTVPYQNKAKVKIHQIKECFLSHNLRFLGYNIVFSPLTMPFIPMQCKALGKKKKKEKHSSNNCGPRRSFCFKVTNFQKNKTKPKTKGKWSRSPFLPSSLLKRMKNIMCQCTPRLFQMLTLKHSHSTHLSVN